MSATTVQGLKSLQLMRPVDQFLRLLLAVVATSMLLLALDMAWMLAKSTTSHPEMLQIVLLTWISALLYGGVCGLIAALKNRLAMAAHVVACWLLIAVLHVWYIVDGRHRLLYLPQASSWSLIAKISADLLCVVFVAVVALTLRWKRVLLGSGGLMLHTVAPVACDQSLPIIV